MWVSLSLSLPFCPFSCDSFFPFCHIFRCYFLFCLHEQVSSFHLTCLKMCCNFEYASHPYRFVWDRNIVYGTRFSWCIVFFHVLSFWIATPWMVDRFVCCYWPFMHNFHFTPQKPPKKILQESKFINSCPMYARTMYTFSVFLFCHFHRH